MDDLLVEENITFNLKEIGLKPFDVALELIEKKHIDTLFPDSKNNMVSSQTKKDATKFDNAGRSGIALSGKQSASPVKTRMLVKTATRNLKELALKKLQPRK